MTVGAIVVGGDYRGLGLARSLGRAGIPVRVVYGEDRLATRSRYCRDRVALLPGQDPVDALLALLDRAPVEGWVVFPTSEDSAWSISRRSAELAGRLRLTTSSHCRYVRAADKRLALQAAEGAGVATPRTWLPDSVDEADDLDICYPAVLKPTIRLQINAFTDAKAWLVTDRRSLVPTYRRAAALVGERNVLLQEFVPGSGATQLAVGAVCDEGRPLVTATVIRRRQYPARFGQASTYVETVDRPDVLEAATRMMLALQLSGPVEVEFKQDARDGVPKLLDVNARVWGWHSIGAAAGADFGLAAYRLACGDAVPEAHARPGVRWMRMSTDVVLAAHEVAGGRMPLRPYLASVRAADCGPIWAADDVGPALLDVPLTVRRLARKRRLHLEV